MKEAINRLHYLLTGTLASAATGTYTQCTATGLTSCSAVVGWESLGNDFTKIAYDKYPVIVIDIDNGANETWTPHGPGISDGGYERTIKLTIDLIVKSDSGKNSLISTDGVLTLWGYLDTLIRSDACKYLEYGGNRYADEIQWPHNIEDGVGADQSGRIYARARRAGIVWRMIEIDA